MAWLVDILAGLLLALVFYGLVRLRMLVAPKLGDVFGQWARWTMWGFVILLMIAVANLELMGLRQILHSRYGLAAPFMHELLFSLVGFGAGLFLIVRHVTRFRDQSNASAREQGTKPPEKPSVSRSLPPGD